MSWYHWVGLVIICALVIWAEHKIATTPAKLDKCDIDETDSCGC